MASNSRPRLFSRYWAVVWLAGLLVPRRQRNEWRNERRQRLWHWALFLQEHDRPSSTTRKELSHWVWHSFAEALWTRMGKEESARKVDAALRSPRLVLAACLLVVAAVVLLSGFLPITRSLVLPLPYGNASRVGLAAYVGSYWSSFRSTVPDTWANVWQSQSTTLDGIAQYAFSARLPGRDTEMVVGHVSPNFFSVLGTGAALGRTFTEADRGRCGNCLVVSDHFWRRELHADRSIAGREIQLGVYRWQILGVLPRSFWFVTHDADGWIIMPPPPIQLSSGHENRLHDSVPYRREIQVARLVAPVILWKPGVSPADAEHDLNDLVQRFIQSPTGHVVITPVQRQVRLTLLPYVMAFFAGLLITLLAAWLRYRDLIRGAASRLAARWWSFLALKTAILLLATTLAAVELVRVIGHSGEEAIDPTAWPLSIWLCLALGVTAMMWSLRDQRYRCRVCLSKLGLAVMVGDQSRLLLDSGATEFVCPHGHGMLHISSMETSWIDAEHWTRLDPSWKDLFGE
ncbi:MAG: ABC transporter permease [Acidobacteria bacterium]|nr:ABC transporter permease [Acidobacteriota bacterium]